MTIIRPNSISGITSVTAKTTDQLKLFDVNGAWSHVRAGVITATKFVGPFDGTTADFSGDVTISGDLGVAGTVTYEDVARVDATGISTFREGFYVGPLTGIAATHYKDGSIRSTGIITATNVSVAQSVTATTYYGSGANLTGISVDTTKIETGNTKVETVDTGSDGHVKITTEGTERLRIDSSGNVGVAVTNPSSFNSDGRNLVVGTGSGGQGISIYSANNNYGSIYFADGTSGSELYRGAVLYNHSSDYLRLDTAGGEKIRIGSSGEIGVGGGGSISFGTSGQFLKSGGNSAGCQWASPAVRKVHSVYYSNTSASFNGQAGTNLSGSTHYPVSARIGGNFTKVSGTSKVLVQGVLTYAMSSTNIHGFCVWISGDESNYVNTGGDTRMWDFYTTRNGNICVWPFSYIFNTAYGAGTRAAYAAPCVNGTRSHTGELNPNPASNSVNNQGDTPGKDCHSCLTVIEFEP